MLKFRIVSDSMMPLIPVGAEVALKKHDPLIPLKRFDIIVFKKEQHLFCHYIWHQNTHLNKNFTITRALKTHEFDDPIEVHSILGLVTNYKISFFLKFKILFLDFILGRKNV